jgi:hypothetical protein
LDPYINNELAMSYLAAGAGVPFIAFLQPYLSLEHKVVGGDIDRDLIKGLSDGMPALLPWLDAVYPVLRSKLEAAAASHSSLQFVDLSLMFTNEQVFADNAHMRCEDNGLSMPGNELVAAQMADEIVKRVYPAQALPDWRLTHIEGTPVDWNEKAYLDANPDVAQLVAQGKFPNGYAHYAKIGFLKGLHSGFPSWDEKKYLADNPDVAVSVAAGTFASGYDQYLKVGRAEGRIKGFQPRFFEGCYLWFHQDIVQAIVRGEFESGLDHYVKAGAREGRDGGFCGWDEDEYRAANVDVRNEIAKGSFTSGLDHYLRAGASEGRRIMLGTYIASRAPGTHPLPDWRKIHIEGAPVDWNDQAYLDANPDVARLVAEEKFPSGYAHYVKIGFLKGLHSGFPSWDEKRYLTDNPDVAAAVASGAFASGFDQYLKAGRAEGRLQDLPPRWVEDCYLWFHQDVAQAIKRGEFNSGLDHYARAGAREGRNGGFCGWDEEGYRFANGDVRNEIEKGTFTSGVDHYFRAGAAEGRPIRLGTYVPPD